MAQDKQLARIEAKLDALLEAQEIDPAYFGGQPEKTAARPTRELTAAEQQAIANAPKVTPAVERNANTLAGTAPAAGNPLAGANADDAPPTPNVPSPDAPTSALADLGLTTEQEAALRDAGYADRAALAAATDDELIAIPTIGKATVASVRAKLK